MKTLSEKKCKILVNKIDLDVVPFQQMLPAEKLEFEDGYFAEDVKEKIQNAQRRLREARWATEDAIEEINKIFLEEFGGDLI